nr:hypothetical protein [Tanacetum cinerariifolium]
MKTQPYKILVKLELQRMEMASRTILTPSKFQGDTVVIPSDAIPIADLEEAHGRFGGLTPLQLTSDAGFVNKNMVEPIELVDKEDAMDEEMDNDYNGNFVILEIKEDECMPLILGTSFLTKTKAEIKFDKGIMKIKAGNCKIRFVRTLEHPIKIEKIIDGDLDPIIPTYHVNRRSLEWEERIKNHQEKEM